MLDERTKKAFLSKARHNLKNPVNAILGYSEMLVEDCEDAGYKETIYDLNKLHAAGKEILTQIEKHLDDKNLDQGNNTIMSMGRAVEVSIRTPLNTIIGLSELLLGDEKNTDLENFSSDVHKIAESGHMLTQELNAIIDFNVSGLEDIRMQSLNTENLTMVKDVMDSIQPLGPGERKSKTTGSILVVDDNENNTELLKKRLGKQGHAVTTANNGKEALVQLMTNENSLDLLLLDIVMPEMNGYEVLKFIRSDKRFYNLPVIMISSMDDTDSIYRCIEIGADDYIQKPFEQAILDARITSCIEKKQLRDNEIALMTELEKEQEKSENLLLNILPHDIAERLKAGETDIATKHDNITILFADIVNFTPQSQNLSPNKVVNILNKIFISFDNLAEKFSIEKIKTIGDNYFAVGGLYSTGYEGAKNILEMAKEMIDSIKNINITISEMDLNIRIGIHTGPIVAGVIGKNKFAYDLWGASVNMASRMESTGKPGKIHVSEETQHILKTDYTFEPVGKKIIKGIGEVDTYMLK